MFDLKVQDRGPWAILHKVGIDVVSLREKLGAQLTQAGQPFGILRNDPDPPETNDAPDVIPPVVLLLHGFVNDRKAGLVAPFDGVHLVPIQRAMEPEVTVGIQEIDRQRIGIAAVSEDGKRLYPIREGIPVLLSDEAVSLPLGGV